MTGSYDVGIVGCGSMGRTHARCYREHDRTNVVAAAELDPETREEFAAAFDVPSTYETHEEMLAAESPDVVSVCTLHSTHAEIAIDAAERGADGVWCEKPMATSLGEARDMIEAVERNGTAMTIGHKRRFYPAHERARELIENGAIGEPRLVTVRTDGGLLNWGSHVVDLARYLLGDPDLAWVAGQVERETDRYERGLAIEDCAVGRACFETGARLTVESDAPGPEIADSAVQVTGSAGVLTVDLDEAATVVGADGTETYEPESAFDDPYEPYLAEFVAWLDGDRSGHRCSAARGLAALEVLMGIYESARTRSVVTTPIRTRANPLVAMIESGDLPVENPGAYDIRLPYGSVRRDD